MKQQRNPIVQMLVLLVSIIILPLGSLLFLRLLERFLYLNFNVFINLTALQPLIVLLAVSFVIYSAFSSGLIYDVIAFVKYKWLGSTQDPIPTQPCAPVKIALLSFRLYDPGKEILFNKFLDSPVIPSTNQRMMTPVELIEETALNYIRELDTKYGSKVVIETILKRGSLEAFFQITAVDIVVLMAAYHDLVESARLFRGQMNGAVRNVRSVYRRRTGRTMRVTDELEIAPKPTQSDKSEDQQSVARDRMNAPQPINVTNSYIPPQSNRGMSITVNTVGHRSGIGGCIHTCLLSLSIIAFIGISFLFLFVDFEGRQNLLEEFVNFAGHLMRTAARWLLWLANTIAPQYTEFW